jgi:serine/threonine protein kinase
VRVHEQVGSVDELFHGKRKSVAISEKTCVAILRGISNGMAFLHKHGVAHRDLKSANVRHLCI